MSLLQQAPRFDAARAADLARTYYGLHAAPAPLPSERDQNFLLETSSGERFVMKIANATESPALLEAQNGVLGRLAGLGCCPRVITATTGEACISADGYQVRLVTWLPGRTLGETRWQPPALLADLGLRIGQIDRALEGFDHEAARRAFHWDLLLARPTIAEQLPRVADPAMRRDIERVVTAIDAHAAPVIERLPRSIVHNDANDYNVLVSGERVSGVIDFGDMVHSVTIADPAVAMAYASLDKADALAAMSLVARGYHSVRPFSDDELSVLFDLAVLRLCLSVCVAADQQRQRPGDEYLAISQEPIRRTLPRLARLPRQYAGEVLRTACERPRATAPLDPHRILEDSAVHPVLPVSGTLSRRRDLIGGNLSIAYERPLKVARGWMQYLFDDDGRRYLDAYNNVPHVGHAHPRVCEAIERQARMVNTNTRYLHDGLVTLAERLLETVHDPLRVCFFVNSGSEANELALRLARTHTRRQDVIVLEGAYHGNTTTLVDISPYKFAGAGGQGPREWVHVAAVPDTYRGPFRTRDAHAGRQYADSVAEIIDDMKRRGVFPAAFIAESWPSVAGQLVPPPGYLGAVYRHAREAGAVCIADEVQTAYGRIGLHFYSYETQGVVPDIVVLGKPIGNGYPLGAVITTQAIARSFDNGMEFFSTFGGSTVSCAAGLAVLDVVQDEELQSHAARAGAHLAVGLEKLMGSHHTIGDVRGAGLFLGVELVRDRVTREPAAREAARVVNRMREEGILLGTEGPHHNVLKIRPPMPFTTENGNALASTLDRVLAEIEAEDR